MGKSATCATTVAAIERQQQALELRKKGLSYYAIARELGCSQKTAHKRVSLALLRLNEKIAESTPIVRRLEVERLDRYLAKLEDEMKHGDTLRAIDIALKIQARRSALLGVDVSTPVVTVEATQGAQQSTFRVELSTPERPT